MSKLKSNILFNFVGNAWLGLLTLIVTPIQVNLLGIEAFGFVGLIAILQILFGSFDLGIAATVTKTISSDHSTDYVDSEKIVNTASTVYWTMAVLLALVLLTSAETIVRQWATQSKLDPLVFLHGVQLVSIYLTIRWPVAFYSGIISGLQRMDLLNVIKAIVQTLRLGGSAVVLMVRPDLIAFLYWLVISALIELTLFYLSARYLFPRLKLIPYFSVPAFSKIWKYSASMNLIGLTALVLSQADRIVVTQLLTLEALGYYTVAYTAATIISLIQSSINNASFPAFSYAFSQGGHSRLAPQFNKISQLMCGVLTLPCCIIAFFSQDILRIWLNNSVAISASTTMGILALGFFLNAVTSNAYIASIACGQQSVPLKINLIALFIYLPALYFMTNWYGIIGAATAYAGLNFYYLITLVPIIQFKLIRQSYLRWLQDNVVPYIVIGTTALGLSKLAAVKFDDDWQVVSLVISGAFVYALAAWYVLPKELQHDTKLLINRFTRNKDAPQS